MAQHKKSELVDPRAVLPPTTAVIMIEKATKQLSREQKPMVVLDLKTLGPDTIELPDGGLAQVSGRELKHYVSFSQKALKMSVDFYEKLSGESVPEDFDDEVVQNDLAALAGKVFNGKVYSEPYYETEDGTPRGKRLVDPATGRPIIKGYSVRLSDVVSPVRELTDPNPMDESDAAPY
jgi:hypothetical protein